MALAVSINHGIGGVVAHSTTAAAVAHHTQGRFTAGMGGGLEHHFGDRVLLHLFQRVDPSINKTIVSFAVVVDVVDADLVVVQPDLVVGIRHYLRHRPPGHGARRQSLQ